MKLNFSFHVNLKGKSILFHISSHLIQVIVTRLHLMRTFCRQIDALVCMWTLAAKRGWDRALSTHLQLIVNYKFTYRHKNPCGEVVPGRGFWRYRSVFLTSPCLLGAIHTSELDWSEIDLSPKRSECERSNANWDRSKIDLNECEHFLKAN